MPISARRSLRKIDFFSTVLPGTIAQLERRCRRLNLEKGDMLAPAGEPLEKIFFLFSGELRCTLYTPEGKILFLPPVTAGAIVNPESLVNPAGLIYSIAAAWASSVAFVRASTFKEVLTTDPRLTQALISTLVTREHALIAHIEELTTLNVRERIHRELLRLCREDSNGDGSAIIHPIPTHEDIAHRIGTHREAVSREMSHLQHVGVIIRRDGALLIPDVVRLKELNFGE